MGGPMTSNQTCSPLTTRERIIVPLDVMTVEHALAIVEETRPYVGVYKVGLELFSNVGPIILDELKKKNVPVFFDGKFHDIPNTVSGAVRAITSLGVFMLNVHAAGGAEMLKQAAETCKKTASECNLLPPKLLGVTILTSIDDNTLRNDLGWNEESKHLVTRLALLCKKCGLDGVVASANESQSIRQACGPNFLIVTPGIRPAWSQAQDQKRVTTPKEALSNGSDYLVVGRPITEAKDRGEAAKRLLTEIENS
jgi:orotidine-5'-phosphate decarboxylase